MDYMMLIIVSNNETFVKFVRSSLTQSCDNGRIIHENKPGQYYGYRRLSDVPSSAMVLSMYDELGRVFQDEAFLLPGPFQRRVIKWIPNKYCF